MSELRGLGAAAQRLESAGGRMLAVCASRPGELEALARENSLVMRVLSDPDAAAARAFGLLHEAAGPDGEDLAIPAHFLLRPDGSIAWRFVARRINERCTPQEVLAALEAHLGPAAFPIRESSRKDR